MTDIASSLEQEFADISHAERESSINELRKIEAAGRGNLPIRPHAIIFPLVIAAFGAIVIWGGWSSEGTTRMHTLAVLGVGGLLLAIGLIALLAPRKPRFTLTETGVQVKDALLPWASIEDYDVVENSYNGITSHTSIRFMHSEGFTPPKLDLAYWFGTSTLLRKQKQFQTRITLHAGARGMNVEKLAQRIGDYLAAAHARAELARLRAE